MNSRRAFTLIELLVVISIVAILLAILLPVLRQAKAAGQSIQCLSNQRQIGLAILTYANDNDNYPPPLAEGVTWTVHVISYVRNVSQPEAYGPYNSGPNPEVNHDPFMFCPTLSAIGMTGNPAGIGRHFYTNYCVNSGVMGVDAPAGTLGAMRPLDAYLNATQVGLLWDGRAINAAGDRLPWAPTSVYIRSGDPNAAVSFAHIGGSQRMDFVIQGGSANVLYLDGHAEGVADPGLGYKMDIYESPTTGWLVPDF